MYFGNRTQSNRQDVNLNTSFFASYSETASLNVGAWNKQLSIQLRPAVGKNESGLTVYAEQRDQYISTSITPENATCLVEGFEKEVLPAIQNGTDGSASIVMGNPEDRKILTVGYKNGTAYLSIATELNDTGKAAKVITHTFSKKSYLVNYQPSEGGAAEAFVETDLLNFIGFVRKVQDLAPVTAHSIRYFDLSRPKPNGGSYNAGNSAGGYRAGGNTQFSAPVNAGNEGMDFLSQFTS